MHQWWFGTRSNEAFLRAASVLALSALSGCSSQTSPMPGAQTPTTNVAAASSSSALSAAPPPPGSTAPSAALPDAAPSDAPAPNGKMCGGIAGFRCAEKQYCAFALDAQCGAGDQAGTCKSIPDLCTMEFSPVCGCDGKTYGSTCVAARSGVSVAKAGACPADTTTGIAEGKLCGTRGASGECAGGLYCAYRSQCGASDAGGKCTKKPELCPHLVAPVCGCDTKTYNNSCEANRSGVSVSAPGACKTK